MVCARENEHRSKPYWAARPQVQRVQGLIEENKNLKRLLGQAQFEISVFKEVLAEKP